MSPPVKAPRRYDSSGRQAQARESRARILEAARARFLDHGYGATTVPAVASDAGVSAETVYKAFTNKAGLLKAVCDVALVGDDEPVPMNQRPPVRAILAEPDPRQKVAMWSESFVSFAVRAVPVLLVVREPRPMTPRQRRCGTRCSLNAAVACPSSPVTFSRAAIYGLISTRKRPATFYGTELTRVMGDVRAKERLGS